MTQEELLVYGLAKPGAWRDQQWEGDVVAKLGPKILTVTGTEAVGLELGPDREVADEWLHRYPGDATVSASIGRYGRNVLRLRSGIPEEELYAAIDQSHEAVVAALPKARRPHGQA